MRIGIYGGTFNPIHNGHVGVIKGFIEKLSLDKLLVIPTAVPPHKQASYLAKDEDRIEMCRIALDGISQAEVCDIEIKRGGKSYTANTLQYVHDENPKAKLFLLMGEDMFLTLQNWYEADRIFELSSIAVAPRSHDLSEILKHKTFLENEFNAEIFVETIPYNEISSTQIRELYKENKSAANLLSDSVVKYISDNKIYKEGK